MIKKPKEIRLADVYLGRGEYSRVIRLLEPKIPLFLENKEFYVILAKAFFYTGDYSGAKLYFDRGQKITWDVNSALYIAVLGLKRRDFNSALRIWLDILDEDPDNKMAKKGLATLKKYSTMDDLENFIHSKKIDLLIPRKKIKLAVSTIITLSFIGVLIILTFLFFKLGFADKVINPNGINLNSNFVNRDGIETFDLSSFKNDYIDFSKQSNYTFSGAQIEDFFVKASKLFNENKDNRVRSYLNLIKYSNANTNIKKKAELLESYLVDPNWSTYEDSITFKEVDENLFQYESCLVKWKGKISNLRISDKKINFSLLVGYDKEKVLDGVVHVELNENIKIQENQPIEVLGRVVLKDNSFYLEAMTVLQYVIRN